MSAQLNGIVVLDKPVDISSAQAVAKVKKILGASKCGHAGTLDPFATGVLICCVNQATRLSGFFLRGMKTYEAVMRLGIRTDTQDRTGREQERHPVPAISDDALESLFQRFEGRQLQQPPIYSALKHEGTALYKLARMGHPVQKAARPITIERLRLLESRLPDVHFEIRCSAGTYVRTVCADLGDRLGCGAHLAQLRRTASSHFRIHNAIGLAALQSLADLGQAGTALMSMTAALEDMPTITADNDLLEHIRHGRTLTMAQMTSAIAFRAIEGSVDGFMKVVDRHHRLRAVVEAAAHGDVYNYCCVFH